MEENNDNDLALRLANDGVDAFNSLYWKYHAPVYANVLKLIKTPAIAEDIVQEVFISLWNKRHALNPGKSVGGWLFMVSYHKAIDQLKLQLKESLAYDGCFHTSNMLTEAGPDLADRRLHVLHNAILHLSPQNRKVFELCKLNGKTYDEAATELHISKHTVKEYLSVATNNIKKYIRTHPDYLSSLISAIIYTVRW